nr:MAG: transcriptional coactivator [Bacteriophage sp.]
MFYLLATSGLFFLELAENRSLYHKSPKKPPRKGTETMNRTEFDYKIIENIATLTTDAGTSYQKELNIISWKGQEPVYDLRLWRVTNDQRQPLKGITLTAAELAALKVALNKE